MNRSAELFVQSLVKYRFLVLVLALLLGAVSFNFSRNLQFDRSIENMFAADDQSLAIYEKLKRTFGGNEIVMAVYSDPQLFDESGVGIRRCREIQKRFAAVSGVKAVLSIDQPMPGEAIVQSNFIAERTRRLFQGYTHGADGHTVAIVCMLQPESETEISRQDTIKEFRKIAVNLPDGLPSAVLTGEPLFVVDGFRYVEQDGRQLARWSAVLLGATIVLCFRSLRWVAIPIAVVQLSILLTNGVLVAVGLKLSMVSSMLVAVVTVIGVATMVHVIVRFRQARASGLSTKDSVIRSLAILLVPVFWACMTDAAGFLALTQSTVGPVQDFGVMMAVAATMVFLCVFALVPGLALLGSLDVDPQEPWGGERLNQRLKSSVGVICDRPKRIVFSIFIISMLGILGMSKTEVETDFTKNFRADSDIVQAYQVVETKLGGAGVCDILLRAPKNLSWSYLKQVRDLTDEIDLELAKHQPSLDEDASVTKSLSLANAVSTIWNLDSRPKLLQGGIAKTSLIAMQQMMPEFFAALHGFDPESGEYYLRLMLRIPEQQSSAKKQLLIDRIQSIGKKHFDDVQVTGYFVLLSNLIESVLRDQWRTFAVAVVCIGLLMWVAFRDLRLAIIALIPNSLPILIVIGMMGWLRVFFFPNLKVNIGVAMIAAVSMGLSIDSSIHYIISFQRAYREVGFNEALEMVQQNVGRAMVLSTLSLIVGFSVLASSKFVPTIYFGSLVSLAMIGGLLGNLVILPALLQLFARRRTE